METLIIIVAGVLVTSATYLLLSQNVIRVILGTGLLTHAVHLLIMAMGGFSGNVVPIIGEKGITYVDALPQALILTSIVINFAVAAFFLVLAYQLYNRTQIDDLSKLRRYFHE
ncbi:MAG TPA: Na(+)/H(+) antiporter subunit C [Pseudogracilibacillus sp.]|nr:Na(+)/H(+) antiporter subunit C [Pseudogracilibacillus sp.]